jgi:hypothetical protein
MLGLLDAGDRMLEKRWQKCDVTSEEASSVMAKEARLERYTELRGSW